MLTQFPHHFTARLTRWAIAEASATSSRMSTTRDFLTQSAVRWTSSFNIFLVSWYSLLAMLESVSTSPRSLFRAYLRQRYVECLDWRHLWRDQHTILETLLLSPQQDVHFSISDPNVCCVCGTLNCYQIQPVHTWSKRWSQELNQTLETKPAQHLHHLVQQSARGAANIPDSMNLSLTFGMSFLSFKNRWHSSNFTLPSSKPWLSCRTNLLRYGHSIDSWYASIQVTFWEG